MGRKSVKFDMNVCCGERSHYVITAFDSYQGPSSPATITVIQFWVFAHVLV